MRVVSKRIAKLLLRCRSVAMLQGQAGEQQSRNAGLWIQFQRMAAENGCLLEAPFFKKMKRLGQDPRNFESWGQ